MSIHEVPVTAQTLTFEQFWTWFQQHPNCIIRAGTADAVFYDYDDFHWYPGVESNGTVFVQMLRGKRIVADLVMNPGEVAFVKVEPGEREGEFFFDLCDESQKVLYYFVLSHGYDEEEGIDVRHWN